MNARLWREATGLFAVTLLLGLLPGCKQTTSTSQVEMKMAVAPATSAAAADITTPKGNFFTNGFPTDLRVKPDGKVDISDFPRRYHLLTNAYVQAIDHDVTGYSPLLPIYIPFTAPILTDLLPTDEMAYAKPDAPVQLVDVDPNSPEYGRRFPLSLKMNLTQDQYRPANLLEVLPLLGLNLRPKTTYALIVTDSVPVSASDTLVQNPQLQALLDPANATTAVSDRAQAVYAPLRDYLAQQNIDPSHIIGATVWTTGDMKVQMKAGAQYVADMPTAPAKDMTEEEDYPNYCVISGTVDVPGFQEGTIPYALFGGNIQFNSNNIPQQQYTRTAKWVVTIPKHVPMPANGFPILSYHHGAGGNADQVFTRGEYVRTAHDLGVPYVILNRGNGPSEIAAERGWASSGMAGHMSMDALGVQGGGYGFFGYDMFNPVSFKYNYYQMVWERIYFRRFLNTLAINGSLCPDATPGPDGKFHIDPNMQVSMGQSLGNWTSSLQVANDPKPFQGAIFTGIAGTWMLMFIDNPLSKAAFEYGVVNLLPGKQIDMYHPFLALLEWQMSDVDPTLYMDEIFRYPTKTAPDVLAISGTHDTGSNEVVQRTFLTALGVDTVGPELGTTPDTNLFGYLEKTGARHFDYPVVDNLEVPGQAPRTAVVVRYANTVRPDHNGHHVTYDLPGPKHQYGCMLEDLAAGRDPVIIQGYQQDGPCQ